MDENEANKLSPMDFQLQLHRDNQERFQRLEENHAEMLVQLTAIATNTACVPLLMDRVDKLESDRDKGKGALAAVFALGPVLDWAARKILHM